MVLQLCPVKHRSLNNADDCRSQEMTGKKIKLEDAISEIQVPDTDSESDAKASDVEDYFEEEEEEEQQQQQLQASAKLNHSLQQVADYQPGDRLKEGTQIFILQSIQRVQQKVDHEIVFPPPGSNSTQQFDTVIFMWG